MNKQLLTILIISAAVLLVVFLAIKNNKDRKNLITPEKESDSVGEENMDHNNRRDKL